MSSYKVKVGSSNRVLAPGCVSRVCCAVLIYALAIRFCKSTIDQIHLNLTTDTVSGTKVDTINLT